MKFFQQITCNIPNIHVGKYYKSQTPQPSEIETYNRSTCTCPQLLEFGQRKLSELQKWPV